MWWFIGGIIVWIWLRHKENEWRRIEQVRRDYEWREERADLNNSLNNLKKKINKFNKRLGGS